MPIVSPGLHPVAATPITVGPLAGLLDSAIGLGAGWLIGWLVARLELADRRDGLTWALASVGVILGWQAVVLIGLLAAVWLTVRRWAERRRPVLATLPATMVVAGLTFVWIALWQPLARLPLVGGW